MCLCVGGNSAGAAWLRWATPTQQYSNTVTFSEHGNWHFMHTIKCQLKLVMAEYSKYVNLDVNQEALWLLLAPPIVLSMYFLEKIL